MGRYPCCSKEGLNRGAWSKQEDMILSEYIQIHGEGGWTNLPERAGLKRHGKSCRLRWVNYLRPDIKRGSISPDEEELIIRLHRLLGNRWSLIAGRLPGRTDNEIKNYWNTHVCKKLLSMSQSQPKTSESLERRSKCPSPVQTHVFKSTPIEITRSVRHLEMVRPDGYNGYGRSTRSSDETMKLSEVQETTNYPKSLHDLLLNDDSENIVCAVADDLVESEGRNSNCSLSSLADKRSQHSDYFAGDAASLADKLFDLNDLSTPDGNLLSSLPNCSTDFGLKEFYSEPTTMAVEAIELEDICCCESNTHRVNSLTVTGDEGIENLYNNTQCIDWILELDYIQKSSPQSLSLQLFDSEDEWNGTNTSKSRV